VNDIPGRSGIFPDALVNDNVEPLVKTLFPSRYSWVLNLGRRHIR
jgi:hypothetical protein